MSEPWFSLFLAAALLLSLPGLILVGWMIGSEVRIALRQLWGRP